MRFYDEVLITVESGKGGDGTATGRRETGVPFGGPSGGNGGKGGSVIFVASKDENTLIAYKYKRNFKAKHGEAGKSKDQYGAHAEDLILVVPVGTMIRDCATDKVLHVMSVDKEQFVAVKGGEGGLGNMHFKDSVHQFPNFALFGEPGQKRELLLELQLLADVALIGTPSVGKSTLINAISHTKAKTADYPFTTLVPNLGSVKRKDHTFNVIDIPGLIKGSADGKGLGNAFLRHVLKARVFCMMVDISRYDQGLTEVTDLLAEIFSYVSQKFQIPQKKSKGSEISLKRDGKYILLEVVKQGEVILEKRIMFVINKFDVVNDEEILQEYKSQLFADILNFLKVKKQSASINQKVLESNTVCISAVSRYGIDSFLNKLIDEFDGLKINEVYHMPDYVSDHISYQNDTIINISKQEKKFLEEEGYMDPNALKYANVWEIRDYDFCKLVWQMPWGNAEAEQWFWKHLEQKGILQSWADKGINKGDVLKVVSFYPGKDDRYILY